jgi:hypothetical protein
MTDFSRLSRFGMMFKPLTDTRGEELLMSFRGAFHVRTLVLPEEEKASQDQEVQCGNTWRGSLAKYNPNTSSWKTAQCSLFVDLELSLETFQRWGSMRNGELYQRQTLVRHTLENESGLLQEMWPTPIAKESNGSMAFKLTDAVDATVGRSMPKMQKNVEKWKKFQMWPTPVCQDSRHAITRHLDPNNDFWKSNLGEVVMSTEPVGITGRLNPMWVEWLMGWPLGWTDLKPLEMDKFQQWCASHGKQSAKEQSK